MEREEYPVAQKTFEDECDIRMGLRWPAIPIASGLPGTVIECRPIRQASVLAICRNIKLDLLNDSLSIESKYQ